MVDANATDGAAPSQAIGDHQPAAENLAGTRLHQLLEAHGMIAPSTFAQLAQGDQGTWRKCEAAPSKRIDYACVPAEWAERNLHARVIDELDLMNPHADHVATGVYLLIPARTRPHGINRRKPICTPIDLAADGRRRAGRPPPAA